MQIIMNLQIAKWGVKVKNEKLINKRGLKTQKEVANAIGINHGYYSMIENGIRIPPYNVMIKIADYYGVKPDYFFYDYTLQNAK